MELAQNDLLFLRDSQKTIIYTILEESTKNEGFLAIT